MRRTARLEALLNSAKKLQGSVKSKLLVPMFVHAVEESIAGNKEFLRFIEGLEQIPVDIDTFLDSTQFLGATDLKLWPEVRKAIVELNQYWWKGMEGGAHKEAILAGATGCVSADTEYLTPEGWKRIDQYVEGELVMQYNADGTGEFVHPREYINLPCDSLLHFHSAGAIDQLLSREHHIAYFDHNNELEFKTADQVATIHNEKGFRGKFKTTFDYPKYSNKVTSALAALAILSHHKDCTRIGRCDYEYVTMDKERASIAKWLCEAADIDFKFHRVRGGKGYTIRFACRSLPAYRFMDRLSFAHEAVLFVEPLITEQRKSGGIYYSIETKLVADYIQLGLATQGERSTVLHLADGMWQITADLEDFVTLRSKASARTYETAELVPTEDGRKYCFSVPSSMLVLRRNGIMFVTGNTGKTEITKVTLAYHLHILGCMKRPQTYWNLPSQTSIVFPIQAAKNHVVKRLIYTPLRKMVEAMPWFLKHMRPDRLVESEMYFVDKNIRVFMGNADDDAILGEAVIGCAVDEINFMVIVEKSKKAAVGGRSGKFDQARLIYTALSSRKKGRFTSKGVAIGILMIGSSTKYKGDFTDKRIAEVRQHEEAGVYIYRKAQYQVQPQEKYCGETFGVVIANNVDGQTRMLKDDEVPKRGAHIERVPIEFKDDFDKDVYRAIRDYCGIADNSISPFIKDRGRIQDAVDRYREAGETSLLIKDVVDLEVDGMPQVRAGVKCRDKNKPRYIHIDLSLNGDPCGVAMVRFDGMIRVTRENGITEMLPKATIEMAATIKPSNTAELDLATVRSWATQFRSQYGFPVRSITYDQFQSVESRQQLKKQGVKTGRISVDKSVQPYVDFKDAIYEGRLNLCTNPQLLEELSNLEYDAVHDKVDHPIDFSKDTADASCGAYNVLLTRSATWNTADGDEVMQDIDMQREEQLRRDLSRESGGSRRIVDRR